MKMISITDIDGFEIGNAEDSEKGTGCTVIICREGAVGGVDVRGGGPATRETDLLRSENTVNAVNAVVLSGGSAFGLESASGVMRELADMKIGFDVGDDIVVPIVCGASLYDLPVGEKAFPDIEMGMQAVHNAFEGSFEKGNHGAGTGATVGKIKGYDRAMKSGLGAFACGDGVVEVGAVAAVNAVGDIYNGAGNIIAGLRSEDGKSIYGTIKIMKSMIHDDVIQIEEKPSFVKKSDIREVLAAAAIQYRIEEELALKHSAEDSAEEAGEEPAVLIEEPETESEGASEEPAASQIAEFIFRVPDEHPDEDFAVQTESEIEETEESTIEETAEAVIEESAAEPVYDEISIPVTEPVPEAEAEEAEIQPEAACTEHEAVSEAVYEESDDESIEKPYDESDEEPETIPEEAIIEDTFEEPDEFEAGQEDELTERSGLFEEDQIPASDEVTDSDTEPEPAYEETEEEPEEEPVVLTREEMGYDIVFNTTISCLITNAALTKSQANKLASILHDAYARAIKPVHGTLDGDTVFVLATGKQKVNFDAFAALATDVMQYAIIDGAISAESAYGLPAAKDLQQ